MKKLLSVILAVIIAVALVSCGAGESVASDSPIDSSSVGSNDYLIKIEKTINMGVVNGAPALAVANIAGGFDYSDEKSDVKTNVNVEKDAPSVIAGLTNNSYDMAILPLNIAAKLYNADKLGVKLVSVNIFSVLYVITTGEYNDLNDLKGKTVYSVGLGGTPDVAFKSILESNGIAYANSDDVSDGEKDSETVYFNGVSQAAQVIAALKTGEANFAILGEPVVTQAMANPGAKIAFSIEDEWKKAHPGVGFVQAGLIVKSTVLDVFDGYIDALLAKMGENADYLKANADKAHSDLAAIGAALPALTETTLSRCLIGADKATERKADVEAFLSVLKPEEYGGKLPASDFYAR